MLAGLKFCRSFTYMNIYPDKVNFVELNSYENYLTVNFSDEYYAFE